MTSETYNQRAEPRFEAQWPLKAGADEGVTRNLSASGLCFELDASTKVGQVIFLVIDLNVAGHKMQWHCQAEVVRTTGDGGKVNVGAKILEQKLVDVIDPHS